MLTVTPTAFVEMLVHEVRKVHSLHGLNESPDLRIGANIHLLHALYRRVSHKRRRRIEELWDADAKPKLTGLTRLHNLPTDLPNALFQCSKAFEQLRYAYENQFQNVRYYVGDFAWILMRTICKLFLHASQLLK